jgi:hypothetical protein
MKNKVLKIQASIIWNANYSGLTPDEQPPSSAIIQIYSNT